MVRAVSITTRWVNGVGLSLLLLLCINHNIYAITKRTASKSYSLSPLNLNFRKGKSNKPQFKLLDNKIIYVLIMVQTIAIAVA